MEGGNEKVGDIKRILMEAFKKRLKFFTFGGGGHDQSSVHFSKIWFKCTQKMGGSSRM